MTSTRTRFAIAAVVLLLLAAIGWRVAQTVRAPKAVPVAVTAAVLEVPADEIVTACQSELLRAVDFSGSVRAAQSAVVKAKVAAEIRMLSVREGDAVKQGQVLVRQDTTEFDWRVRQADQQAQSARAQLEIAQRALTNNRALVAQGFISPTALESSVSNEAAAQANLQAALAGVEIARKALADATLTAPMNGLVSQRLVQPGERVAIDARILEIVDLSKLEIEAALAPEDVSRLRIGQAARATVDGISGEIGARVARINPSAQAGSRTVSVYLVLDPHPALRHGLFARGRIELERAQVLALPASAVRADRAEPYVLALQGDAVKAVTVGTGLRGSTAGGHAELVEITRGLPENSRVLSGTLGDIADGTRWKPAAATPPRAPASGPAAAPSTGH